MKTSRKLLPVFACLALAAFAFVLSPPKASALAPLSFHYDCDPPDGVCDFTILTSNHALYTWSFGDGSSYGPTTSTTASHDYNFTGSGHSYNVTLTGYATNPPSSPDNIIGCTVEAQGPGPGGNPGDHGTCN
jgi:hypothetical protein